MGIFARKSLSATSVDKRLKDSGDDVRAGVTGNLYGVFACIRMRCMEDGNEDIVHGLFAVHKAAVMERLPLGFGKRLALTKRYTEFVGDADGIRTGNADYGYCSALGG